VSQEQACDESEKRFVFVFFIGSVTVLISFVDAVQNLVLNERVSAKKVRPNSFPCVSETHLLRLVHVDWNGPCSG
jgi:hypothetical protein